MDRQQVDDAGRRAASAQLHLLALAGSRVQGLDKRLAALNPVEVLRRGYAIVTRQVDGRIVRRVAEARDLLRVRVSDGEFGARVQGQSKPD